MHLKIFHKTHFEYSAPATHSYNEARLCPWIDARQSLNLFSLSVEPGGSQRRHFDFYNNAVDTFEVAAAHDQLSVTAQSEVTTLSYDPSFLREVADLDQTYSRLRDPLSDQASWDFLTETALVPRHPDLWKLGIDATAGRDRYWPQLLGILGAVYEHIRYDAEATRVQTDAVDALSGGRGVCQDYAHVFIGVCRALQIPARYISGYFYTEAVTGSVEAESALASHAWSEVSVPGVGWIGLDPTHNCVIDERYVAVARGRDYADARPLSGAYMGAATGKMEVDVRIQQL